MSGVSLLTVIAAIAKAGTVTIAGDRQSQYSDSPIYGARKIRRLGFADAHGEFLLAAAGNGAMLPVIEHGLTVATPPSVKDGISDADQWADAIAIAIAGILADANPPLLVERDGEVIDGALLLAHSGRLWYVFTHMAVPVADGVAALGAGGDIALGAMHVALGRGAGAAEAAMDGVRLACLFAPGCGVTAEAPVQVEQLSRP